MSNVIVPSYFEETVLVVSQHNMSSEGKTNTVPSSCSAADTALSTLVKLHRGIYSSDCTIPCCQPQNFEASCCCGSRP